MKIGNVLLCGAIAALAAGGWTFAGADSVSTTHQAADAADPYLWLEDVHGERAMQWVKAQNARSLPVLQEDPDYQKDYDAILKVLDALGVSFEEFAAEFAKALRRIHARRATPGR